MKDIRGRCAFVTGAASGIGLELALAFAQAGAHVVLADIEKDGLAAAAAAVKTLGVQALPLLLDVTDAGSWGAAADRVEATIGPVHILCNNAGVGAARATLDLIENDDWNWVFNVNVNGVRQGIKTFVPRMKRHGQPSHIVNTASILGLFAAPSMGDYVASKYAVLGISETLRMELAGTEIGVSVLCPGIVATRITRNTRLRRPSSPAQPAASANGPSTSQHRPVGVSPACVAEQVVSAVLSGSFYIFTHPEYDQLVTQRFSEVASAFLGAPRSNDVDDLTLLGSGMLDAAALSSTSS